MPVGISFFLYSAARKSRRGGIRNVFGIVPIYGPEFLNWNRRIRDNSIIILDLCFKIACNYMVFCKSLRYVNFQRMRAEGKSIMDMNRLYSDHQKAMMQAGAAFSSQIRREREFDASLIAGRIGCMQRALGAEAAYGWEALAVPSATEAWSRSLV